MRRRDTKVASLVLVKEATEDRWRIKIRPGFISISDGLWHCESAFKDSPAHEVDTPIKANKSTGVHIAHHAIVFNGKISARLGTAIGCGMHRHCAGR